MVNQSDCVANGQFVSKIQWRAREFDRNVGTRNFLTFTYIGHLCIYKRVGLNNLLHLLTNLKFTDNVCIPYNLGGRE